MTIRIIKLKPSKDVEKKCVCNNCGATLGYTPRDVKYATYKDYGGGSDTYAEFNCPNCGKKLQICQ